MIGDAIVNLAPPRIKIYIRHKGTSTNPSDHAVFKCRFN